MTKSSIFILRHSKYESLDSTNYDLFFPTSAGELKIPQLGGTLTLNRGINILYSTAEVFTWKKFHDRKVLVVYGGPDERHELAISGSAKASVVEGSGVKIESIDDYVVLNWETSQERRIARVKDFDIFILGE